MNEEPKKFTPCQRRIKLPVLEHDYDDFGGRSYSYWTEPQIPSSCTRTAIYVAETSGRVYCWQCAPRGAKLRCYWTDRKIRQGELRHWPRTTDIEESIQISLEALKRLRRKQEESRKELSREFVLMVSGCPGAYLEANEDRVEFYEDEEKVVTKEIARARRYLRALEARLKR